MPPILRLSRKLSVFYRVVPRELLFCAVLLIKVGCENHCFRLYSSLIHSLAVLLSHRTIVEVPGTVRAADINGGVHRGLL